MHEQNLRAPAKINLALHVMGKLPNGYHEVVTLYHRVNLWDEVRIVPLPGEEIQVVCPDGGAPEGTENIAYRAAELFGEAAGSRRGVRIVIRKRIPQAAGLGGGSSDAATVLTGLNRIATHPLSRHTMLDLGRRLGADVPFFLWDTTTAVGRGIGDRITPVRIRESWFVLVYPRLAVSTAWAYGNLKLKLTRSGNPFIEGESKWVKEPVERILHNDLESVTARRYPVIEEMKRALEDLGAGGALMSGSGPTVFGYFQERSKAYEARERLSRERGFPCFLVRSY